MLIRTAATAGFCFGVNRAVDMTYALLGEGRGVCTLGPLIHNPQVIDDLESRGVKIVSGAGEAKKSDVLVVRTHGVPREVMEDIRLSGIDFCDATCPFVKKIHRIVTENSSADIPVFILGDKNHPEVRGIESWCNGNCFVFKNCDELTSFVNLHKDIAEKELIVVAQTTFSAKEWKKCRDFIKFLCTNAKLFDTICNATYDRQAEAMRLAAQSDIMIIIGGRQSSNTQKLKTVCEANCPTYLIEKADELSGIDFSDCHSIGVTAGASTPARIIKEVQETMSEMFNEENQIELEKAKGAASADAQPVKEEEAAEIDTVDEMDFSEALEESLKKMNTDQQVRGVVMGFSPTEIQVDIGRKHAGFVPLDEYSSDPKANPMEDLKVGDEIDLIIMKTNDQEGTVMLSKRRCDAFKFWNDIIEAEQDGRILDGVVSEVIRGGVLVACNGTRVFIPASLATLSRSDSLDDMLGQPVKFRIIEVNRQRKRAVGSIRAVSKELRREKDAEFWAHIAVGQTYTGKVKSMTSYGAFVDLGGVDGMVHISELSWKRIKHPSEIVNVGDEIEVYIKAIDEEKRKISLGYKKDEDNPWEVLRKNHPVDSVLEAEVVGMTTFGAFARIIPGIDGLIHISQIANRHIEKPQDALKIGDKVTVKVTAIDFDKKRVSLSIRALLDPMDSSEQNEAAPAEETAGEAAPAEEAVAEAAPAAQAVAEDAEEAPVAAAEETPAE